jgi:hypothetical protein
VWIYDNEHIEDSEATRRDQIKDLGSKQLSDKDLGAKQPHEDQNFLLCRPKGKSRRPNNVLIV